MAAKEGLAKFQGAMIKAAQTHLAPILETSNGKIAEVLKNQLFELDGPTSLAEPIDPRDKYFGDVFRGFLEITKSLQTLDDIAFYIRRFPFAGSPIDPARYLQFHVEAHFSEIYILRERLVRFIKFIERKFKRDPLLLEFQTVSERLVSWIESSLGRVVTIRGKHVHEVRFTDEGIDRLDTIATITRASNGDMSNLMKRYFKIQHRKVRKKWRDTTKGNIKAIRALLDQSFEALYPVVFNGQDSSLRYPRGARSPRRRA